MKTNRFKMTRALVSLFMAVLMLMGSMEALFSGTYVIAEEEPPVLSDNIPDPTPEPTATPTSTPEPADESTPAPTPEPTEEPTQEPKKDPTPAPAPTQEPTPEPTEEPTTEPKKEPVTDTTKNASYSLAFTKGWAEIHDNTPLMDKPGAKASGTLTKGIVYALSRANTGEANDCLLVAYAADGETQTAYVQAKNLRPLAENEIADYLSICNKSADALLYKNDSSKPLLPLVFKPLQLETTEDVPEPKEEPADALKVIFTPALSNLPGDVEDGIVVHDVPAAAGIDITKDFTDPNFLAAVRKLVNKPAPAIILDTDVNAVTDLYLFLLNIKSLNGLKWFTNLKTLDCQNNQLTSLPPLPSKLEYLNCSNNQLTLLPTLPAGLEYLYCYNNKLSVLPTLPSKLSLIDCGNNLLKTLPVLPNNLSDLYCPKNLLTSIDVSNCRCSYIYLDCRFNNMKNMKDVKGYTGVWDTYIYSNNHNPPFDYEMLLWNVNKDGLFYPQNTNISVEKVSGVTLTPTRMDLRAGGTYQLKATITPVNAANKNVSYSSGNTKVATVSASGFVKAIAIGTAVITVKTADGSKTATCTVTVKPAITASYLPERLPAIAYKDQAFAISLPTGARLLSITTNKASIASISGNIIEFRAAGRVNIKISYIPYNRVKAKVVTKTITVKTKVTGIKLNTTSATIQKKQRITLSAIVSPVDATLKTVTWSSSNRAVATVTPRGVVTGKIAGITTITATTKDGGFVARATVTVNPIYEQSISLNKTNVSILQKNKSVQLRAKIVPANTDFKAVKWTSSNSAVATISQKGKITAIKNGVCIITATTVNGKKATCMVTVGPRVKRIYFNPIPQLYAGDTLSLMPYVVFQPIDAANKAISWSSNNTSIATVNASGIVKGIKTGTATIFATTNDGNYTATCGVIVKANTISISPSSWTNIPSAGGNKTITVTSSGPWTAMVPDNQKSWITLSRTSGTNGTSFSVTVKANTSSANRTGSITFTCGTSKATFTVAQIANIISLSGSSGNISSITFPYQGGNTSVTVNCSGAWTATTNQNWITLSKTSGNNGQSITIATAPNFDNKRTGTIAFCCEDVSITFTIIQNTVICVNGVSLNTSAASIEAGKTYQLKETILPSDASDKSVVWTSSNTYIATVSNTGMVTGLNSGNATITAKTNDGNKTASCVVTVRVPVTGISFDMTSASIDVGNTRQLVATVQPANATNKSVTWSSSNTAIATVNASGLITGVASGSTTITAKTNDGAKTISCAVKVVIPDSLSLSATSWTGVSASGDVKNITITSIGTWTAVSNQSWITLSRTSGTNGVSTSVTVSANTSTTSSRTGSITFTCGTTNATLTITQNANTPITTEWNDALAAGQTLYIRITRGGYWIASTNQSWITLYSPTGNSGDGTYVSVDANTGTSKRSGTVIFTSGIETATLTVTQLAPLAATINSGNKQRTQTAGLLMGYYGETLYWTVNPTGGSGQYSYRFIIRDYMGITMKSSDNYRDTGFITSNTFEFFLASTIPNVYWVMVIEVKDNKTGEIVSFGSLPYVFRIWEHVTGVSLNTTSATVDVGKTYQLTTTVSPSNAYDSSVTWASSNTSIATVSTNGLVTAKAAGEATITVKTVDGGYTKTCKITVKVPPSSISLNTASVSIELGKTYQLNATISPSNATNKSVTWSSSNTNIATVSASGLVTAKATGSATITVKTADGGLTKTCSVTVNPLPLSATTTPNKTSPNAGETVQWFTVIKGGLMPYKLDYELRTTAGNVVGTTTNSWYSGTEFTLNHTEQSAGTYYLYVKITDSAGKTTTCTSTNVSWKSLSNVRTIITRIASENKGRTAFYYSDNKIFSVSDAWCVRYAVWVAQSAIKETGKTQQVAESIVPNYANTPLIAGWYMNNNRYISYFDWKSPSTGVKATKNSNSSSYLPKVGDLAMIENLGTIEDGPDHTGIVCYVSSDGSQIRISEGNTSGGVNEYVYTRYNGVYKRSSTSSVLVSGFCMPNYP